MEKGLIEIYCGNGRGKTSLGVALALRASIQGKSAIIIQFLKGKERSEIDFLEEQEKLDLKIFRFEKMDNCYEDLTEQEKEEENLNIINGVNFARKVIATQECDFLLLDEILGLLDIGIVGVETIQEMLKHKDQNMHIVMTGRGFPDCLRDSVDSITTLMTEDLRQQEGNPEQG